MIRLETLRPISLDTNVIRAIGAVLEAPMKNIAMLRTHSSEKSWTCQWLSSVCRSLLSSANTFRVSLLETPDWNPVSFVRDFFQSFDDTGHLRSLENFTKMIGSGERPLMCIRDGIRVFMKPIEREEGWQQPENSDFAYERSKNGEKSWGKMA